MMNMELLMILKKIMQAGTWLRRDDTAHKQGEFYILLLSTLLGMYFMVGAGNFLLFFLGMELASVPMACLVAFDKYKHHSAEAGAKYILCALFASGLMLYGISFFYGTTGTLYFGDMAAHGYGFGKPAAHDGEVPHTDSFRLVGLDIKDDRHTAFPGRFVDRKPIRIGGNGIPPVGQHIQRRFRPRTQRTGSDDLHADFTHGVLAAASSALSSTQDGKQQAQPIRSNKCKNVFFID